MINIITTKIGDWFFFLTHIFSLLSIKDVIDIVIVAILTYFVLVFVKQSRSSIIAYSVIVYLIISYLAKSLDLGLTRQLLQLMATAFILIFVIVFQRELRRFFDWIFISSRRITHGRRQTLSRDVSFAIMKAVQEMALKRIGALIVLPGELPLDGVIEGGFFLDGRVSSPLLLSIFDASSPGHDGAVIIDNNRLKKFGVHLPLAEDYAGFQKAGTRHRAAAGVTERTDSLAIVVSEERGEISFAENGQLTKISEPHILEDKISQFISESQEPEFNRFWGVFLTENWTLKLLSLVIAFVLWFTLIFQIGVISKDVKLPVEMRFLDKNFQVVNVVPREITVTFVGNNHDLGSFTGDQVKAFVDLKMATSGTKTFELSRDNLEYPRYLELTKISPKLIGVTVTPVSNSL